MTETDTFESGIGVLASDRGAVSDLQEESPIAVSGVAIPENQILQGGQGVEHFFSPQKAQEAAQVLSNQIGSGDIVHLVKNFHDVDGQATADDVIGEVTSAGYQKGVGVVFQGEITDEDIANKINLGYLDVSPSIMRSLGGLDETMQAREVDEVAGFRDIAVVARGQPGAEVNVGPNPAVEALSRNLMETDTLEEPEDPEEPEEPEMSFEDALKEVAEEYELEVNELEDKLTESENENVVKLIEAD